VETRESETSGGGLQSDLYNDREVCTSMEERER